MTIAAPSWPSTVVALVEQLQQVAHLDQAPSHSAMNRRQTYV